MKKRSNIQRTDKDTTSSLIARQLQDFQKKATDIIKDVHASEQRNIQACRELVEAHTNQSSKIITRFSNKMDTFCDRITTAIESLAGKVVTNHEDTAQKNSSVVKLQQEFSNKVAASMEAQNKTNTHIMTMIKSMQRRTRNIENGLKVQITNNTTAMSSKL